MKKFLLIFIGVIVFGAFLRFCFLMMLNVLGIKSDYYFSNNEEKLKYDATMYDFNKNKNIYGILMKCIYTKAVRYRSHKVDSVKDCGENGLYGKLLDIKIMNAEVFNFNYTNTGSITINIQKESSKIRTISAYMYNNEGFLFPKERILKDNDNQLYVDAGLTKYIIIDKNWIIRNSKYSY